MYTGYNLINSSKKTTKRENILVDSRNKGMNEISKLEMDHEVGIQLNW